MAERTQQGGVAEKDRGHEAGGRQHGQESGGVVGTVADAAKSVESVAGKAWETTAHGAQQAASAVAHTAEDAWGAVNSCMSRNPLTTFLVGMGVGALLVLAMQRRS